MKFIKPLSFAVFMALVSVTSADAKVNAKYLEKMSKSIWNQQESTFDPNTAIADSLLDNNSAVIISALDIIDAKRDTQVSAHKASGEKNRSVRQHTRRTMVKLLDESAVEHFSEFEFDGDRELKLIIVFYRSKSAFGARIHKPDGSIREIDASEAIEVADGKKEKDNVKYKLAIPGLEVGDVLEYFYYDDEMMEELNLSRLDIDFYSRYPILHRELRGKFDNVLTVECRSYNGAPMFERTSEMGSDITTAIVSLDNIPAVSFKKYTVPERQLPFIRMNFLNNTSALYHPRTARSGGLYTGISTGRYYSDILSYFSAAAYDDPLPGNAAKIVKNNYLKDHPDATPDDLADAGCLAARYCAAISDRSYGNALMTLLLLDVFDKLNVAPKDEMGFAFFTPVTDIPTEELSAWNDPYFMTTARGRYFSPSGMASYLPGEPGGYFQSQKGGSFTGTPSKLVPGSVPEIVQLPDLKHTGNRSVETATVNLADDDKLIVERTTDHTGIQREVYDYVIDTYDWIDHVEDYLSIPAGKRYKDPSRDDHARQIDIRKSFSRECEEFMGIKPDSVLNYAIVSHAILPGENSLSYKVEASFADLIQNLGDDMVVSIGKLMGDYQRLEKAERERLVDAQLPSALQTTRTYTIRVPEGYEADATSVEKLNVMNNNILGMFTVQAQLDEDGNVVVQNMFRVKNAFIPLAAWPHMLDLLDTASDFSESKVVLTRKG